MFSLRLADDIELSLLEERDAEELYALVDANRAQLERFLPWAAGATLEAEQAFLRASLERFAKGGGFDGGLRVEGALAGALGVFNVQRNVGRAEFGYWLAAAHRGRGLMTRAVAGLTRVMFEEQGFNRLEIRCERENLPSRKVAERLGFRHEGTLRAIHPTLGGGAADLEVFGLLRSEWLEARERQERTA
ncbi:MAG: GNAT family protein [Deinococcales bacterium]